MPNMASKKRENIYFSITSPLILAWMTSWVLVLNPVFDKRCFRWVLTVFKDTSKFSAIWLLVAPVVSNLRTSISLFPWCQIFRLYQAYLYIGCGAWVNTLPCHSSIHYAEDSFFRCLFVPKALYPYLSSFF